MATPSRTSTCDAAGGWVAYTRRIARPGGNPRCWRRDPSGNVSQVSASGDFAQDRGDQRRRARSCSRRTTVHTGLPGQTPGSSPVLITGPAGTGNERGYGNYYFSRGRQVVLGQRQHGLRAADRLSAPDQRQSRTGLAGPGLPAVHRAEPGPRAAARVRLMQPTAAGLDATHRGNIGRKRPVSRVAELGEAVRGGGQSVDVGGRGGREAERRSSTTCGDKSDLEDYTGEVLVDVQRGSRTVTRWASDGASTTGTMQQIHFRVPVQCVATRRRRPSGATCSLNTTFEHDGERRDQGGQPHGLAARQPRNVRRRGGRRCGHGCRQHAVRDAGRVRP